MALYVRVAKYNRGRRGPDRIREFANLNEEALAFDKEKALELIDALREPLYGAPYDMDNHSEMQKTFEAMPQDRVVLMAEVFVQSYPQARKALGGLARTAEAALSVSHYRKLDSVHYRIASSLQELKRAEGTSRNHSIWERLFPAGQRKQPSEIIQSLRGDLRSGLFELERIITAGEESLVGLVKRRHPRMYELIRQDYVETGLIDE